ncbi:MAG TPA: DNA oxidative demethylase AlkB [Burkholderiaceae bacterium]|nr:DNA oxidative demethylase AlkB [Burkholderiaceae bacterium]
MAADLFEALAIEMPPIGPGVEALAPGALVLRGFARAVARQLFTDLRVVVDQAPFRQMITPGGLRMSVAMTNCGELGWVSDRRGYRYDPADPDSGRCWPAMPASFVELAQRAAERAGFGGFAPDACLVNRYAPGARLSLHQDRDERDFGWPIVSVSLGLPAIFQFGGPRRSDKARRIPLQHGDVVVWGGSSRLHHHGVLALADGDHALTGRSRLNLTFRKAG